MNLISSIQTEQQFSNNTVENQETYLQKTKNVILAIPKGVFSAFLDLSLLPLAGGVLALSLAAKIQYDPSSPKKNKIPILLLHGSSYNETEWLMGRHYLNDHHYGSVYSLNYDGLLSNDPQKGIDDHAKGKVRDKILKIKEHTEQNEVIIIGHSMGGLIGGYYTEECSEKDGITVNHVISIGSPWKGAPALNFAEKYMKFGKKDLQMKVGNLFLNTLASKCLESERSGRRKYYTIGSTTDFMVPSPYSDLTESPTRQRTFTYLGHYGLIAAPPVWSQICAWISAIPADQNIPR